MGLTCSWVMPLKILLKKKTQQFVIKMFTSVAVHFSLWCWLLISIEYPEFCWFALLLSTKADESNLQLSSSSLKKVKIKFLFSILLLTYYIGHENYGNDKHWEIVLNRGQTVSGFSNCFWKVLIKQESLSLLLNKQVWHVGVAY